MNKEGLARFLGMSMPTLRDRLARDPEFPVLRVGAKGIPWEFDADVVKAYLAEKARVKAEAEAARRARLSAGAWNGPPIACGRRAYR